jgi:hypothetical protein
LECGGKRSATPLCSQMPQNVKKSKAPSVVGALQISWFTIDEDFFSTPLGWKSN